MSVASAMRRATGLGGVRVLIDAANSIRTSTHYRTYLTRQLTRFIRESADMQVLIRQIDDRFDPQNRQLGTRVVGEASERILVSILRDFDASNARIIDQIMRRLVMLIDDMDEVDAGRAGRTAAERRADLQAIEQSIGDLKTMRQHVADVLTGSDSLLATRLLRHLERELGLAPSHRGLQTGTEPPPRLTPRTPAPTRLSRAVTDLLDADLAGDVQRAARVALDAAGGNSNVAQVVRRILSHGSGTRENARVIAVLLESEVLVQPRKRRSYNDATHFEELVTGSYHEFTGHLRDPARSPGFIGTGRGGRTIGIDGINNGFVRDAKWVERPVEISPHVTGQRHPPAQIPEVGGRAERQTTPELHEGIVTQERSEAARRARQQYDADAYQSAIWKEREIVQQMMRQMQFADENGLHGIEWVVSSREMAEFFERIFSQQVQQEFPHLRGAFVTVD